MKYLLGLMLVFSLNCNANVSHPIAKYLSLLCNDDKSESALLETAFKPFLENYYIFFGKALLINFNEEEWSGECEMPIIITHKTNGLGMSRVITFTLVYSKYGLEL